MITEIRITDPSRCCVVHWANVPALAGKESIPFKPGLNILWGPNGCGKSTALTLMARMLHCEQGNRTVVTGTSVAEVFKVAEGGTRNGGPTDSLPLGVAPVHDGQCVLHFDPGVRVGLIGGGFDWDFGTEGIANAMTRGSSGETVIRQINEILKVVVHPDQLPAIEWKFPRPGPDVVRNESGWAPKLRQIGAFLDGTLEKGTPTVLLDEPDRSLSLRTQAGLWDNMARRYAARVQVIAASHSPFALRLPGANYIDLVPGYLAECEDVVDRFMRRAPS